MVECVWHTGTVACGFCNAVKRFLSGIEGALMVKPRGWNAGISVPVMSVVLLFTSSALAVSGPWDNPPPLPITGNVVNVSNVTELLSAVTNVSSGDTILLAAGTYNITENLRFGLGGAYSNIAIRGATGDRNDVIIKGNGWGNSSEPNMGIQIWNVNGMLIADLTIGEVYYHAIQIVGQDGARAVRVYNCRFYDTRETFLKVQDTFDFVCEYSVLEYTDTSWWWYTHGIDGNIVRDAVIRYNLVRNVRGPAGVPYPRPQARTRRPDRAGPERHQAGTTRQAPTTDHQCRFTRYFPCVFACFGVNCHL